MKHEEISRESNRWHGNTASQFLMGSFLTLSSSSRKMRRVVEACCTRCVILRCALPWLFLPHSKPGGGSLFSLSYTSNLSG